MLVRLGRIEIFGYKDGSYCKTYCFPDRETVWIGLLWFHAVISIRQR